MHKHSLRGMPRGLVAVRAEANPIEALNRAFEAFKTEHTASIEAIRKDVVQAEKVDRINDAIGKLQADIDATNAKIAAAQLGVGDAERRVVDADYTSAFNAHMKKGEITASLNKGTASEGGYLAPTEWDRTITDELLQVSPMRQICSVMSISTNGFSKLFNLRGTASGWVGETAARTETAAPTLGTLTYNTGEIYANPSATQQMLDDAEINLEAWLAGEVNLEFAYQEGAAFLSGNGTNKPTGILTYVTGAANAAAHPFGAISLVNSGAAADLTADGIINLTYALPSEFTGNARFVMNRNTQKEVRLLKDGQNNYLWQPTFVAGQPATLLGYPITEMAGMPDVAASAVPILFGDFQRGYLIVDRTGVRVLRDPFTNKPYVHFYTTKRVGGGLLNPQVLRGQTIAA